MVKLQIDILDTNNLLTFGVIDQSIYDKDVVLANTTLTILVPGFISEVKQIFKKNEINVINSNSLGISNVTNCKENLSVLPDGLYTITLTSVDSSTLEEYCTKVGYYRTSFLNSLFEDAYNVAINSCDISKDKMEELMKIEFYLNGISTNANKGNFQIAEQLYNQTNILLEKFLKRC